MATSNVDIANIALRILGEPPITSLDGTQKAQTLCAQALPNARDEVLMMHPWSTAIKRASLNLLSEADNQTDYEYVYAIPADYLRILAVRPGTVSSVVTSLSGYMEDQPEESSSYVIEGGYIYTNAEDAYAQYIYRVTNPSVLPFYLVDAIGAAIAKRIAYSMVQNSAVSQFTTQYYFTALQFAMQMDARSQKNTPSAPTAWTGVF